MFCRLPDLLIGTRFWVVVSENRIAEGTSHAPTPARPEALWCAPLSDDACKAFPRHASFVLCSSWHAHRCLAWALLKPLIPPAETLQCGSVTLRGSTSHRDCRYCHCSSVASLSNATLRECTHHDCDGILREVFTGHRGPCELQEPNVPATQLTNAHRLHRGVLRDTGRDLRLLKPLPRRAQWCAS